MMDVWVVEVGVERHVKSSSEGVRSKKTVRMAINKTHHDEGLGLG
jgi:hypothetical protein